MAKPVNDAWQNAVRNNDIETMRKLLDDDPSLVRQNIVHTRGNGSTYEKSPLRMVNHSIDAAGLLVVAGADPNDGADSVLAIHNASLDVATYLLDSGAELNRIGYEEETALMYEVGHTRNPETVQLLIDRGADVNIQRSFDGNTAMHFAAIKQHPEMVVKLLAAGADSTLKNAEGQTPLDIARANNATEIIDRLATNAE